MILLSHLCLTRRRGMTLEVTVSNLYKKMVPENLLQDCFPVWCLREPCSSADAMQRHRCPQSAFSSSHPFQFLLSPTPAKLQSLRAQDFPCCDPQIVWLVLFCFLFYVTLLFLLHPSFTHSCFCFLLSWNCIFLPTLSHCWLYHPHPISSSPESCPMPLFSSLLSVYGQLPSASQVWCRRFSTFSTKVVSSSTSFCFLLLHAFFSPKQEMSTQAVHKVIYTLCEFRRL